MAFVVTLASTIQCSHGAAVQKSSSAKLKVGGQAVLLKSSLMGKGAPSCTNTNANNGEAPCSAVMDVSGEATKLKAGSPVLLDNLGGKTNSTPAPPGTISAASVGQSKLKAV